MYVRIHDYYASTTINMNNNPTAKYNKKNAAALLPLLTLAFLTLLSTNINVNATPLSINRSKRDVENNIDENNVTYAIDSKATEADAIEEAETEEIEEDEPKVNTIYIYIYIYNNK